MFFKGTFKIVFSSLISYINIAYITKVKLYHFWFSLAGLCGMLTTETGQWSVAYDPHLIPDYCPPVPAAPALPTDDQ